MKITDIICEKRTVSLCAGPWRRKRNVGDGHEGEGYVHHVGMYIGDGQMIHAPNSESTVEIIDVFESNYYSSEFAGARRYLD